MSQPGLPGVQQTDRWVVLRVVGFAPFDVPAADAPGKTQLSLKGHRPPEARRVHGGNGCCLSTEIHADAGNGSIPVCSAIIIRGRSLVGFHWFPPVPAATN